ncbi:uncharacterized protein LOC143021330 [Oratosquilla oratoria]|uniref:uncharacterized protein LOC143021330 n=1 Tax=Oratosquilla oratoria TaxID=337810 RepID=UPI003F75B70F
MISRNFETMEFGDFDDDLFSEEKPEKNIDEHYEARFCNPEWFQSDSAHQISEEEYINLIRYQADYHYLRKEYGKAAKKFEIILRTVHSNNSTTNREVYEGIARCYLHLGQAEDALKNAHMLDSLSHTVDHVTVSSSLLVNVYLSCDAYKSALCTGFRLLSLHPYNSDIWLKQAYIYSLVYRLDLPFVKLHFTKLEQLDKKGALEHNEEVKNKTGETGIQMTAVSLIRAQIILHSVKNTALGFSCEFNAKFQEIIRKDLAVIPVSKAFLDIAYKHVENEVYSCKDRDPPKDFVDRGSSQFCDELSSEYVQNDNLDGYERRWFHWLNDITS